ncbi:MAG: hypothetical protein HKM93_23165 [Desulfobacteraceae bacterium]|nr:hypothetical protein [Desulfobacteraceae bacterium]
MQELPLSAQIHKALLDNTGDHYNYLALAVRYESAHWPGVASLAGILEIEEAALPALYATACQWSDKISTG